MKIKDLIGKTLVKYKGKYVNSEILTATKFDGVSGSLHTESGFHATFMTNLLEEYVELSEEAPTKFKSEAQIKRDIYKIYKDNTECENFHPLSNLDDIIDDLIAYRESIPSLEEFKTQELA